MKRLALALVAAGALWAAPSASAAYVLGPDVNGMTNGAQYCDQAVQPCTFVNLSSTNPDVTFVAPSSGVITRWRFRMACCDPAHTVPANFTLKTVAPGSPGAPGTVGISPRTTGPTVTLPVGQTLNGSVVETPVRVPIAAGESLAMTVDARVQIISIGTTGTTTVMAPNGGTTGYPSGSSYAMNATVEADGDGDGYGDETQDCAPTDPLRNVPENGCIIVQPPPPPIPPPTFELGKKCEKNCGTVVLPRTAIVQPAPSNGRYFFLAVNCPADQSEPCGGYVTVTLPKAKGASAAAGGTKTFFTVAPGRTAKVKVKLSKQAKAILKQRGKLRVSVTVTPNAADPVTFKKTVKYSGK